MALSEKKRKLSEDSEENDTLHAEIQVKSDMTDLFDMGLSKEANSGRALEVNKQYQEMMEEQFGSDSGAAWAGKKIAKYAAAFGSMEEAERYEAMSTKHASMLTFNPLYPSLHKQEAALPPEWSTTANSAAGEKANEYIARHGTPREAAEALWRDIQAHDKEDELEEDDQDNDGKVEEDGAESNAGKRDGGQHDNA